MRKCPVLICPSAAIEASCHGEREWQIEGRTVIYLDAWNYREWFNLLGFPSAILIVLMTEFVVRIQANLSRGDFTRTDNRMHSADGRWSLRIYLDATKARHFVLLIFLF